MCTHLSTILYDPQSHKIYQTQKCESTIDLSYTNLSVLLSLQLRNGGHLWVLWSL
jgi:hypothetical protein